MSLEIISHSREKKIPKFSLVYTWVEEPEAGFDFPCDENGELLLNEMSEEDMANYEKCEFGEWKWKVDYRGICDQSITITIPGIAQCYCGEAIQIIGPVNVCPTCGNSYNSIGEEL